VHVDLRTTVRSEREINRSRHGTGRLVLAFVDVDKLKQVNDSQGHAAGDTCSEHSSRRSRPNVRSYDPIVRVWGGEFVCTLGDCTREHAHRRFADIRATLERTQPGASNQRGPRAATPRSTRSSSPPSALFLSPASTSAKAGVARSSPASHPGLRYRVEGAVPSRAVSRL
jgi:GGDEF domain-containing protein